MTELTKYNIEDTIIDVFKIKIKMLSNCKNMCRLDKENEQISEGLHGHNPLPLERSRSYHGGTYQEYIERLCWSFIVNLFELEKYMLCTAYEKMKKDIEENKIPEFTVENVMGWTAQLKSLIHDNLNTLVKTVFEAVTKGVYYTGAVSWKADKKKRNNNGIDKFFILAAGDYNSLYGWHNTSPTLTDDFEKACYILDGKTIPELTIKKIMYADKLSESENKYFKIRICKTGNTHYRMKDEKILELLNLIGSGKQTLGENIKIKIFEKRW